MRLLQTRRARSVPSYISNTSRPTWRKHALSSFFGDWEKLIDFWFLKSLNILFTSWHAKCSLHFMFFDYIITVIRTICNYCIMLWCTHTYALCVIVFCFISSKVKILSVKCYTIFLLKFAFRDCSPTPSELLAFSLFCVPPLIKRSHFTFRTIQNSSLIIRFQIHVIGRYFDSNFICICAPGL